MPGANAGTNIFSRQVEEPACVSAQCVICEYAGFICIVVVVVVVPKASAITAKAIVMVNFCINNQYYASYISISLAFFR